MPLLTIVLGTSLFTVACATISPCPRQTSSVSYDSRAIQQIMQMRDNGDGLSDVARQVGGTRADVRAAERRELARRRTMRTELATAVEAPASPRLMVSTIGSTNGGL
jgi:hypothetical protein